MPSYCSVEGIVTIQYKDGSFYEGPYVEEAAIDAMGCVTLPGARSASHYGIYRTGDGRIFEGNNVDNHFDQVFILPNNAKYNIKDNSSL